MDIAHNTATLAHHMAMLAHPTTMLAHTMAMARVTDMRAHHMDMARVTEMQLTEMQLTETEFTRTTTTTFHQATTEASNQLPAFNPAHTRAYQAFNQAHIAQAVWPAGTVFQIQS